MTADMSFLHLITNASVVVKAVMLLLVVASLVSWAIIFAKTRQINRAYKDAERFEDVFWSSTDLTNLYRDLKPRRGSLTGLERIFESGFAEYGRLHRQMADGDSMMDGALRAMRISLARESDDIEQHVPFLATVGSVSPYVGLFGTVWGIMNSFRALGNVEQATLGMVAPGIAEALVATAIGLFAAIPAVVAYNRFTTSSDRLLSRYENFIDEFSSLLHRQVSYGKREED